MSTTERQRSFFSTTAGVVTGIAGLLTALVGLLTVGVQLGWWGSGHDGGNGGSGGTVGTGSAVSTTVPAELSVSPTRVSFEVLGPRETLVTVRNTSTAVSVTLKPPSVEGADTTAFSASDVSCGGRLDPGKSCEVRVRFVPPHSGDFQARLVLQPQNGPAREAQLVGKAVL